MTPNNIHSVTLFVGAFLLILTLCPISAFTYFNGYQQDQSPVTFRSPGKNGIKLKAFMDCRQDCKSKCDHRVYSVVRGNKAGCHTCLLECISAWTEQAEKIGVKVDGQEKMNKAQLNQQRRFYREVNGNQALEPVMAPPPMDRATAYNQKKQYVMNTTQ